MKYYLTFLLLTLGMFRFAGATDATAPKADDPHLLIWLDAADAGTLSIDADGHVSAWKNKSNSPGVKFESHGNQRPLYVEKALGARPTVRFDGVDDILCDEHFGRAAKTWSLVIVTTPRSNKGSGQFHGFFSAGRRKIDDFTSGMNVDLGPAESSTFSELNFESSKDDPGVRNLRTDASNFGEGQILTLTTDAEHTQLYMGLEAENMRFAGDAENSLEEVRIGGRYYMGAQRSFLDGDISEVLFYDTVLADADRAALVEHLAKKYDCASKKIVYSLEDAWTALKTYEGTGSRLMLTPIDQAIQKSHGDVSKRKEIEQRLIAVLNSDAPLGAKEFAIRRLIFVGTEESVPALAKYLIDPQLGPLAQITVQAIPGEASAAAIRESVQKAPMARQLALIQGMGLLRDRKAIPVLVTLLKASNTDVVEAAALALGQIGHVDCIEPLGNYLQKAASAEQKAIAFDANLMLANRLVEQNHRPEAAKIFHALDPFANEAGRCAILAGLVKAEPEKAGTRLLQALADKSPRIRGEAAGLIRTTRKIEVLVELTKHLFELPRESQILVLDAVAHQDREIVISIAREAWDSKDSEVRAAALSLFGAAGDEFDVAQLVYEAALAESTAEKEAAFRSLTQLQGEKIDAVLIDQLKYSEVRAVAVRALGERKAAAAFEDIVKMAKDTDPAVRAESGKALQSLASQRAIGRFIQLLLEAKDDAERSAFEQAIVASCMKIADPEKRAEPILAAYDRGEEPAKRALLPVLGALGGARASELIHAAVSDPKSKLYESGVRALANWPDAAMVPELIKLAKSSANETQRSWEIRGIARVAPRPGALPPAEAFAAMKQAFELADRLEDKKLVISRMAAIRTPESLAFIVTKIDDAAMQIEASAAAAKLAEAMRDSHPREARAAFERVLEMSKDDTLNTRVKRMMGKIKP